MAFGKKDEGVAVIKAANIVRTTLRIRGTAPLVQAKFSQKTRQQLLDKMSKTKAEAKSKSERPVRNYDEEFKLAQHRTASGKNGIPCGAFRNAMIDACRVAGLVMTRAKMSIFIIADGVDEDDGTPLTFIISKKGPEKLESLVRNDNGSADIRIRPMWREWEADVTVEFDADMITAESVVNLLDRAGRQVGVCEGRPFSKNSCGQGWGTFEVITSKKGTKTT